MDKTSEGHTQAPQFALTFIQPINGLKLKEDLGNGESFCPLFFVTNNRARITKLLGSETKVVMGMHFHDTTLDSDAVIYLEGDISQAAELEVGQFVDYCTEFLWALWLVKDHAISLSPSVLRISRPGERTEYSIHTFGQNNFDRLGQSTTVEFSREEIRNACEYDQDCIQKLTRQTESQPNATSHIQARTNFEVGSSRLVRFLTLLERGRNMPDLGIKLGLFCSCLECLFSRASEKNEIVHRVAEKAAFLLEREAAKRKATYKAVKQAYDLRSAVLHGASLSEKELPKLPNVCHETDAILRKVLAKIVLNSDLLRLFTQDEERLQEFFLELLFSGTAKEIS